MLIEKNIHQIWVGEYDVPPRDKEFCEEIKEKHPNYNYFFWTNDNLPEIPERFKRTFRPL